MIISAGSQQTRDNMYGNYATASPFIAKVGGKVFAHSHEVIVKHRSSMWN
jgi:hypothetical protein